MTTWGQRLGWWLGWGVLALALLSYWHSAPHPDSTPVEVPNAVEVPQPGVSIVQAALPPPPSMGSTDSGPTLARLAQGQGPQIEMAWPQSSVQRQALWAYFQQCWGVQLAVLDAQGLQLAGGQSPMQDPSPQLRLIRGPLLPVEQAELSSLAQRGQVVRVFPSRFDQQLLQGLYQQQPQTYQIAQRIQAHYQLEGDQLWLTQIRYDQQPVADRILLASGCDMTQG